MHGDLLGTDMLLHGDGVVSTAFVGEVVGENHALSSVNHTDASDDITRWHIVFETRQLAKCKPW